MSECRSLIEVGNPCAYLSAALLQSVAKYLFLVWCLIEALPVSGDEKCIAVVTAGGGLDYWEQLTHGAQKAGRDLGVSIFARGASDEDNNEGQKLVLEEFEKRDCAALVMAPNSTDRITYVDELGRKGIPTVFVDRDIGGSRVSVVMTDNFSAGYSAAKIVIDANSSLPDVVIIHPGFDIIPVVQRVEGFKKAFADLGVELQHIYPITNSVGEARQDIRNLPALPDSAVFFTPNQTSTVALLAERTSYRMNNYAQVGFDPNPYIEEAFLQGHLMGLIEQNPYQMGYLGVLIAYQAVNGQDVKNPIHLAVKVRRGAIANP